ncbi:GNAT family N-acetyltransferase [Nocardia cyriacigeorgica]|nr:GNAT family N-acetyltransferase [Nocardia cyriacigeorgica]
MSSIFSLSGAVLHTDRLCLRQWPADDLAAVADGERRADWVDDFPAEGDRVIAGVIAQQEAGTREGHRQIVERASGLVVGSISLLWPPNDGALEFGYGIVTSRRGRGYAAEAARAMVSFALTAPEVHTVYADVDEANPASIRVLEKAGLHRVGGDGSTARFSTAMPDR